MTIPCYYTDAAFTLKPASFMDMAQEMAYWAAQMLGFGYDDLQVHHTAWVLSRMHYHFENPPKWRDKVTLKTWHKGADGLFFLRDFILQSPEGAPLVTCTTSWLVMDTETRRLVRDPIGSGMLRFDGIGDGDAIVERAPKVVMPGGVEAEAAGSHIVAYSDIDIIGHTNNARYVVMAMDAIDYSELSSRRVKDIYINFNKETTVGETILLSRTREENAEGLVYYVEGTVDGKSAFTVKIVL
ncbi:MAG: hypothetical protein IK143_07425 [Bacteroidales bacterium]|nr:hypothetical protein [Bacteroidales bacterium]